MYDTDSAAVTTALQVAQSAIFTDETINLILSLTSSQSNPSVTFETASPDVNGNVTVAAGAEVVYVASSDTVQTTVKAPVNAPVVIFQGKGGVIATINDGPTTVVGHANGVVDRIVVGSSGNDQIIVQDAKDTKIILGSGNSSVVTGYGIDTVEAGLGNSSIVGGNGDYSVVKLAGTAANYQVTVNDGRAIVTNSTTNITTDISKIQYVQLDNGKALIFAKDSVEAAVSTLYHTAFGRDADAGGLDYWFDARRDGASLKQISEAFTNSAEFDQVDELSNNAFVQGLYQNTFNRAGEDGGVAYWTDALTHGATRADLILSFSLLASQNIDDSIHTEATVVGSVTIVTGII